MARRLIVLSVALATALALGFLFITPKITWAATSVGGLSIDTTPYWDGSNFINPFGVPNTATYGQTISITENSTLTQFSFNMEITKTAVFRGYVYEWDGTKAKGSALFESAPMSTKQALHFEEVVFTIPAGIVLSAGKSYVLFASISNDPGQPNSAGMWGAVADTSYNGGILSSSTMAMIPRSGRVTPGIQFYWIWRSKLPSWGLPASTQH